jgi:hypothetical protein
VGLDISAYSRLRFLTSKIPEDWDGESGVAIYETGEGFDRMDGCAPGLYETTHEIHVWWNVEHGTPVVPASEQAALETRLAALHAGTIKPECPGDLAVLADSVPVTEDTSFRAGSYSGYNWWREQLCRFALECEPGELWSDPEAYAGKPFVEMINFSDCEGAIGPRTSAKLAGDFRDHEARVAGWAETHIDTEENRAYFVELYGEWKRGFELAAQDGFLLFH